MRVLTHALTVPAAAVDANGHANNAEYVRWMQEAAIAHTSALGWPMERYFARGESWVVRSHTIEYLRPVSGGEQLLIHTWVADMRSSSSTRRYLLVRASDGTVVAKAATVWVYIDLKSGRARRIPAELRTDFELVEDEGEVMRVLT